MTLPYVGAVSERIRLNLIQVAGPIRPRSRVRVVFNTASRIKDFFKVKDATPRNLLSSVVYQVTCSCNARYIGKTIRHIEVRLNEHKKSIGLSEQSRSHIQEHVARTGHAIDFSKFQILGKAKTDYRLKIFESLMIKSKTPELNNNDTSVQLSLFQS